MSTEHTGQNTKLAEKVVTKVNIQNHKPGDLHSKINTCIIIESISPS